MLHFFSSFIYLPPSLCVWKREFLPYVHYNSVWSIALPYKNDKFDESKTIHRKWFYGAKRERNANSAKQKPKATKQMKWTKKRDSREWKKGTGILLQNKLRHNGIWPKALFDVPQIIIHIESCCVCWLLAHCHRCLVQLLFNYYSNCERFLAEWVTDWLRFSMRIRIQMHFAFFSFHLLHMIFPVIIPSFNFSFSVCLCH